VFSAMLAAALLSQTPPDGGWQYARWGMTPAAVVAASGGDVQMAQDSGAERRRGLILATGKADAGPFTFEAEFGFHGGQLSGVYLVPPGSQCGDLQYWLQDLYGAEEGATASRSLLEWRLPETNTVVAFVSERADQCALRYQAMRHAANAGL
jgi:hypothetical protein